MTVVGGITLGIAILGAALGVINTWRSVDASRVKLKVTPGHAISVGAPAPLLEFYIAVTNLSTFPVTIEEVGVFYRGTQKRDVFPAQVFNDDGGWPRRLEPRSSVSVYAARPENLPGHRIKSAYARTSCGVTAVGRSPALRQIAREG